MALPGDQSGALFAQLVATYGIKGALALLPLLSPGTSTAQKGFGAAQLAGTAGKLAGINPKIPGTGIGAVPAALGAGALGYNLAQIAGNENLSTGQKVGHSGHLATDVGMSLVPVVGPFYALAKIASALGQHLQGSGSPQVRGLGRSIDYVAEPAGAKAFWSTVQGDKSPREAWKAQGGAEGLMLDTMGPVGIILRGLGVKLPFLHDEPTTGTIFRNELSQIMKQIPQLKGSDTSKYNIDQGVYEALTPEAKAAGAALGALLMGESPTGAKNKDAYGIQAQNVVLNRYGNDTPEILKQILTPPPLTPALGAAPTSSTPGQAGWFGLNPDKIKELIAQQGQQPMQQRSQFQPGLPNNSASGGTANGLQGILNLLSR